MLLFAFLHNGEKISNIMLKSHEYFLALNCGRKSVVVLSFNFTSINYNTIFNGVSKIFQSTEIDLAKVIYKTLATPKID